MGKAGARPRGPAPKPTKMKVLHGTNRADRGVANEMDPKVAVMLPPAPHHLDKVGKGYWATTTRALKDLGMLVDVDYGLLTAYCHQMSIVEKCATDLKGTDMLIKFKNKAGATNLMPHPYIKMHNDALKIAQSLAAQFGFTPSARTRISAPKKEDGDGFEDF